MELEHLWRSDASHRDDLILQFGGGFEIPQVCPQHVKKTTDGDHYRLRVPRGKNTTGSVESLAMPTSHPTSRVMSIAIHCRDDRTRRSSISPPESTRSCEANG